MSAQHLEPSLARQPLDSPRKLSPEEQAQASDLQAEIDHYDSMIRQMPGDRNTSPAMAEAQDARNAAQLKLDTLRGTPALASMADVEQRNADIAAERDQLVIAQNAPFTEAAPMASGGESAIPEGVVESHPTDPHVISQTAAGVVVHSQPQATAPTK
jgi:hypothetical protein